MDVLHDIRCSALPRPGVAPAPRPAPSSHGSAPPPAPHRQHRILGGRAGQRNRLRHRPAHRGDQTASDQGLASVARGDFLSKATASLTASASGRLVQRGLPVSRTIRSVDEVADRSSRSSGFGPRNREEAGWRRRRRRGCLKQIGVSLVRPTRSIRRLRVGLTSVIKRPGWSLRSASFSTCRPSATARSAAAGDSLLIRICGCEAAVIDIRQIPLCRKNRETDEI